MSRFTSQRRKALSRFQPRRRVYGRAYIVFELLKKAREIR